AVATADIENPCAGRDHFRDQQQVDALARIARRQRGAHRAVSDAGGRPRVRAAASRKPEMVANSSGSSSRKASWPLSVSISTKLTLAATAFRAWTISRLSGVGNNQSLVKEATKNRVAEPRNAFAATTP